MSASVNIADVIANAVRVPPATVKPGDLVFDPMGRTYPVKSVRKFKHAGVRIIREDGVWSHHEPESTITIIRVAKPDGGMRGVPASRVTTVLDEAEAVQ